MPTTKDREKRQSIIDACRSMNALGINQGTSGNISLRHGEGMLITPTSTPYEAMQPEQIVFMGTGRLARSRPAAVERVAISPRHPQGPARDQCGGPCPPALFDDPRHHGPGNSADPLHDRVRRRRHHPRRALCDLRHAGAFGARRARAGRPAGVPAGTPWHDCGRPSLSKAMWLAVEVETLARQYHGCLQIGTPRAAAEGRDRKRSRQDRRIRSRRQISDRPISPRSPLRSSARR